MSVVQDLAALAAQQPVLAGMAAAGAAGSLAWALREAPGKAWLALRDLCSVTLTVEGRDELFPQLNLLLSRTDAARRSQRLMAQDEYDYEAGCWGWKLTLGRGWHAIWFRGRPLFINREVQEGSELSRLMGGAAMQRLWVMSPGRSQAGVRALVADAQRIWNGDGLVRIYFWHAGHYLLADRRAPRSLDTVFLPAGQKAGLVADALAFAEAKAVYRQRGTPYRRGYLFEGPPGTGKTSLIFALAGRLGRSVYVINLASVGSDNDLMAAFNEVGSDGVVVIEDIDTAEISRERGPVAPVAAVVDPSGVPVPHGGAKQTLTLSGLLNAIDGVAAREGRMLFVTSNHAGKLDAALLRSGRIDRREWIAPLERGEAWDMFRAFRPEGGEVAFERLVAGRLPIAASELQNLLQSQDAHGVRDVGSPVSLVVAR